MTRQGWFQECLDAIGKLNLKSVAFPYEIGCGLAGGKWACYDNMLQKFACENPETEVFICRWTGGGSKQEEEAPPKIEINMMKTDPPSSEKKRLAPCCRWCSSTEQMEVECQACGKDHSVLIGDCWVRKCHIRDY